GLCAKIARTRAFVKVLESDLDCRHVRDALICELGLADPLSHVTDAGDGVLRLVSCQHVPGGLVPLARVLGDVVAVDDAPTVRVLEHTDRGAAGPAAARLPPDHQRDGRPVVLHDADRRPVRERDPPLRLLCHLVASWYVWSEWGQRV